MNNLGLIKTVATMDYIFCPIAADRFIMESSLKYASIINDTLITTGKSNIKGIRLLWNMVDKREKTDLYDIYDKVIAGMGLETLKTSLPDSKRFRKEGSEEGDRRFSAPHCCRRTKRWRKEAASTPSRKKYSAS